jgi:hypothetical protein
MAHGTLYALLHSYKPAQDPFGDDEMAHPYVQLSDVEWPIALALISHAEAYERVTDVYGWDVKHWKAWSLKLRERLLHGRPERSS